MLSAMVGARLCVLVSAEFLFGTFCLALTHAAQVKQLPNKIKEIVSVCFALMVAWGLSAALCHCGRLLAHVVAHLPDYHAVHGNKSSTILAWNNAGFVMSLHVCHPGSW